MATQMYLNMAVRDLERSKAFFTRLGFGFYAPYTDDKAACMVVGENIYVMLLRETFFKSFTKKELCDTAKSIEVMVCLSCDSREKVDELLAKAVAGGGGVARKAESQHSMYGGSFEDLDGHIWELLFIGQEQS